MTKRKHVSVINSTLGGTFFLEGRATVVNWFNSEQALVDFHDGYGAVERYVDPNAQGLGDRDLADYIATLNDPGSPRDPLTECDPLYGERMDSADLGEC